jgi:NSS family neurotransmitter:Na+ symporter
LKFFLYPDFGSVAGKNLPDVIHAAMAQAFFTLSLGIGSIAVCGSYFDKIRSLPQEGFWIVILDTAVAMVSGLIIFPCCYSFDITPDAGPPLIFITLPKVFQSMTFGQFWGALFFLFLSVAAVSTLIAVFENLAAFGMDEFKWGRKFSCAVFGIALALLTIPCILGFNWWSGFHPLGAESNILDLEDFIVSDNLLPLGALCLSIFCMNRFGWGEKNFYTELNTGKGWKMPAAFLRHYFRWILPLVIFALWLIGIIKRFAA